MDATVGQVSVAIYLTGVALWALVTGIGTIYLFTTDFVKKMNAIEERRGIDVLIKAWHRAMYQSQQEHSDYSEYLRYDPQRLVLGSVVSALFWPITVTCLLVLLLYMLVEFMIFGFKSLPMVTKFLYEKITNKQ